MQLVEALPKAADRARGMVTSQLGLGGQALSQATAARGSSSDAQADRPTGTAGEASGSLIERAVSAGFAFAGHLVVIVFLVFFLLLSGHHVKDRLLEVMGPDTDQQRATATIIDDINTQIQRYLLVLLFTAGIVGVVTCLVLAW